MLRAKGLYALENMKGKDYMLPPYDYRQDAKRVKWLKTGRETDAL